MDMGAISSREKKKKQNSPSLKTVGDNSVSEPASQHSHGVKDCSHLSNAKWTDPREELHRAALVRIRSRKTMNNTIDPLRGNIAE
jgi:hypothetical protein